MKNMDKMMSKRMGMMSVMHTQAKVKCAEEWLKKAIDLHEVHIKDPRTATEASQMGDDGADEKGIRVYYRRQQNRGSTV